MAVESIEVRAPLREVEVAVVGAGPVGLTVANLLGIAGVQVAVLEANGKLEKVSVPGERGRPTEYWRFSIAYDRRQNDINDKSPLERARELLN